MPQTHSFEFQNETCVNNLENQLSFGQLGNLPTAAIIAAEQCMLGGYQEQLVQTRDKSIFGESSPFHFGETQKQTQSVQSLILEEPFQLHPKDQQILERENQSNPVNSWKFSSQNPKMVEMEYYGQVQLAENESTVGFKPEGRLQEPRNHFQSPPTAYITSESFLSQTAEKHGNTLFQNAGNDIPVEPFNIQIPDGLFHFDQRDQNQMDHLSFDNQSSNFVSTWNLGHHQSPTFGIQSPCSVPQTVIQEGQNKSTQPKETFTNEIQLIDPEHIMEEDCQNTFFEKVDETWSHLQSPQESKASSSASSYLGSQASASSPSASASSSPSSSPSASASPESLGSPKGNAARCKRYQQNK